MRYSKYKETGISWYPELIPPRPPRFRVREMNVWGILHAEPRR